MKFKYKLKVKSEKLKMCKVDVKVFKMKNIQYTN